MQNIKSHLLETFETCGNEETIRHRVPSKELCRKNYTEKNTFLRLFDGIIFSISQRLDCKFFIMENVI